MPLPDSYSLPRKMTTQTQTNGQPAEWSAEVLALFERTVAEQGDPRPVVTANHFLPRPYVDQYNPASSKEGFTYVRGHDVYQVILSS